METRKEPKPTTHVPVGGRPAERERETGAGVGRVEREREREREEPIKPSSKYEPSTTEKEKEKGFRGVSSANLVSKALRLIGVTSIRDVEVVNRQYMPAGTHIYVKTKEGNYESTDVSEFLHHADLRINFTLPMDVNPEDIAFFHQKDSLSVYNPLGYQCTIKLGLIENVKDMLKEREFFKGVLPKTYTLELPLLRGLNLDPFQTLHYTIRIAGLKMPEQTEIFWRIHLKVLQAEDQVDVVSISDHPFDVSVLQDNLSTFGDRVNESVFKPLKRRGWFNWPPKVWKSSSEAKKAQSGSQGEEPLVSYAKEGTSSGTPAYQQPEPGKREAETAQRV